MSGIASDNFCLEGSCSKWGTFWKNPINSVALVFFFPTVRTVLKSTSLSINSCTWMPIFWLGVFTCKQLNFWMWDCCVWIPYMFLLGAFSRAGWRSHLLTVKPTVAYSFQGKLSRNMHLSLFPLESIILACCAFPVLAVRFADDSGALVYIIHTSFYITYCGTSWGQQILQTWHQ